jgi:hypothetical protein
MMNLPPLPASNLLIGGRTLLLLPSLVAAVGLNEAIVLQQVRYRLGDGQQPQVWGGRRWARASLERWQERDFPFWKTKTVQRAFDSLVRQGLIAAIQPDLPRRDATKWYTIDFAALEPVARLVAAQRHARRPTTRDEAAGMADAGTLPPLPPSDLLIDEPPLVIVVDLAVRVGLDEALLLQQLRYWLADERRPPVRDGRRWVCPRDVDMFAPFNFRAPETLVRTLTRLERAGFLLATSRYNAQPGDRTKWYTIDFAALGQLTGARAPLDLFVPTPPSTVPESQTDDLSRSKREYCPDPGRRTVAIQTEELSRTSDTNGPDPAIDSDHLEAADLIQSLKEFQTDPQTDPEIDQQQPPQTGTTSTVVVTSFETALVERGVTRRVAMQLLHASPPAILERQLAIYDWLREADPEDRRLTPGRLRKMIEEDWAPPPGYTAPAERAALAVAQRRALLAQTSEDTRRHDELAAAAAARRELLDRVGLSLGDQALWMRVAQTAPVLPTLFRAALFHASATPDETAAVIFPDPQTLERALSAGHTATRSRIAARVAALCHRPQVRILYLDLPTLCAQLAAPARPDRSLAAGGDAT